MERKPMREWWAEARLPTRDLMMKARKKVRTQAVARRSSHHLASRGVPS